jgi:Transglutaminase-like superfamily
LSPVAKLAPVRRFHPANLRAAWWAVRTTRRTRRLLEAKGLDAAHPPPPPPPLPVEAERGMRGALWRMRESCLVNAIVVQAWDSAHGRRRDLVVGVTGPNGFGAHAWLDGDPVPAPDDDGVDVSVLNAGPGEGSSARSADANGSAELRRDDNATRFSELLRRPAPHYERRGSIRVR